MTHGLHRHDMSHEAATLARADEAALHGAAIHPVTPKDNVQYLTLFTHTNHLASTEELCSCMYIHSTNSMYLRTMDAGDLHLPEDPFPSWT